MKKENNSILALPLCMGLGVALGSALGNMTMGIAFGALAGVVPSCCGLFQKKDNDEENDAK